MTKRTTDDWEALLDGWVYDKQPDKLLGARERFAKVRGQEKAAPEAVAEVARLSRALEGFLGELNDDLAHEGVEGYSDIYDAWPSMQEYGELTVKLAHRNILTRILEGDTDE